MLAAEVVAEPAEASRIIRLCDSVPTERNAVAMGVSPWSAS